MFEGSEKKLEIIFSEETSSLRNLPLKFWNKVVKACGAEIVSVVHFPYLSSYILSESSLFVWDNRVIIITCGQTVLPKAFLKIIKKISKNKIEILFFQRKNELFPKVQKSTFVKDVQVIQDEMKGKSYQFGQLHQHHFFLFHTHSDYKCESEDQTLEILMYDSDTIKDTSKESIDKLKVQLSHCFAGFEMHDHVFESNGYSLNAVRDNFYYTIHITPQESFFYTSFETNMKKSFHDIINLVLSIFKSNHFDLVLFYPKGFSRKEYKHETLQRNSFAHQVLDSGYKVDYMSFDLTRKIPEQAVLLKGEKNA